MGLAVFPSLAAATSEPVLALGFDEGSGSVARDSSAFGNDGAVSGAEWSSAGKHGGALSFDDVTADWVTVPDADSLDVSGAMTLEAWVRPEERRSWQTVLRKETPSSYSYQLHSEGSLVGPRGSVNSGPAYRSVKGPAALALDEWSHLAMTSDGTTLRMYVNGVQVASAEALVAQKREGPLRIGGNAPAGEYFDGLIDDVRIYDRALSAAEIQADQSTPVPSPAPAAEPVLALGFDEGSGSVARDSSAFGNDGAVSGAEWSSAGKHGGALSFDDVTADWVTVPDADSLDVSGAMTLEAWVRPEERRAWQTVLMKESPAFYSYALYGQGSEDPPRAYVSDDGVGYSRVKGSAGLALNAWSHLAATSDGTTMRLYVNGVQVASGPAEAAHDTAGALRIGGSQVFGEYFDGLLDDVRIYDQPLTPAEIQADRTNPVDSPEAGTVVSGDKDSNAPLIIDPSRGPKTGVIDLADPADYPLFIQKMPVTKVVDRVTLGDFARADSCTEDSQTRLYIRETLTGDRGSSQQVAYSTNLATIGTTAGRASWDIPETTLRAGRGYTFDLEAGGSPTCRYLKQTTWDHNRPQVNSGRAHCAQDEPTVERPRLWSRMWHGSGRDDAVWGWGCVQHWFTGSSNFDPSMPSGWLATTTSNGDVWRVITHTHVSGDTSTHHPCSYDDKYVNTGIKEVFWRDAPNRTDGATDWVCVWTQYPDGPDAEVPDGWYYGMPWRRARQGAPGDPYVKLETIDYDALLEKHAPVLKFDRDDSYRADSPGMMANSDATSLHFSERPPSEGPPGLDELGSTYPSYPEASASSDDYLNIDAANQEGLKARYEEVSAQNPAFRYHMYGRATHDDQGRIWLQYWLFSFNQDSIALVGDHQGDWEMVQVRLDDALLPDRAAYAQHGDGACRNWADVEHAWSPDRPDVYVAQTTHASYFDQGRQANDYDIADGDAESIIPLLTPFSPGATRWQGWPGRWGQSEESPTGPGQGQNAGDKWDDPGSWAARLPAESTGPNPCSPTSG